MISRSPNASSRFALVVSLAVLVVEPAAAPTAAEAIDTPVGAPANQ